MTDDNQVKRMLSEWGRWRRRESDVSAVIFGANYTGFSRMNTLEKARRDAEQRGRREASDGEPFPTDDDQDVIAVEGAINRVSVTFPDYAKAIELRFVHNMGMRKIAAAMGCARNTARKLVERSIDAIGREISHDR